MVRKGKCSPLKKTDDNFDLSKILEKQDLSTLDKYGNLLLNNATHNSEQYTKHKTCTEKRFFEENEKNKDFAPLCMWVPQNGGLKGALTRRFYNLCSGTKSPAKRDIINKMLVNYCLNTFKTCKTDKSKQICKNIERNFQPNYCANILRTLFSVFKVRQNCNILTF